MELFHLFTENKRINGRNKFVKLIVDDEMMIFWNTSNHFGAWNSTYQYSVSMNEKLKNDDAI